MEGKRKVGELTEDEKEKERKRRKNEKKGITQEVKTAEQGARQQSWQKFAKKSTKKGVVIPGITGEPSPLLGSRLAAEKRLGRGQGVVRVALVLSPPPPAPEFSRLEPSIAADTALFIPLQAPACSAVQMMASRKPRLELLDPGRG